MQSTAKPRTYLLLVGSTACWGSATAASKYAVEDFAPIALLVFELIVATLILWTVYLVRRPGEKRPANCRTYALLGFLEPALAFAALNIGLVYTSAVNASMLGGLEPVFVVLLAVVIFKEQLGRLASLAVIAALAGALLIGADAPESKVRLGDLLVVGGVLSAAIYVILARKTAMSDEPMRITAYQFLFGMLFSIPFAVGGWLVESHSIVPATDFLHWLAAIYAGVVGLAASFLLFNHSVALVSGATAGMVLNLIPVFGLLTAITILGEGMNTIQLVGGVLILGALVAFTFLKNRSVTGDSTFPFDPTSVIEQESEGVP